MATRRPSSEVLAEAVEVEVVRISEERHIRLERLILDESVRTAAPIFLSLRSAEYEGHFNDSRPSPGPVSSIEPRFDSWRVVIQ